MMRGFVSRRFGRNWRAGVSFPLDSGVKRRGRPPRLANVASRPPRSYYGVSLDQPDQSAELPPRHVYHSLRDVWTIVATLVWLVAHALLWLGIVIGISLGALVLVMGALTRV
jgi:hypothetical protein